VSERASGLDPGPRGARGDKVQTDRAKVGENGGRIMGANQHMANGRRDECDKCKEGKDETNKTDK